jgi:AcrR family transcriptional regulator
VAPEARARPLPRGPHKLSRDEVVESQRLRLLTAMTEAVADKGYANTVVADVVARSGVSRATFYQLFRDKEHCFEAAYEMSAELVAQVMEAGLAEADGTGAGTGPPGGGAGPLERLERILAFYIDSVAGAPALARVFLVEVYAAGPRAIAQRRASLDRFVDIVAAAYDEGDTGDADADVLLGTRANQRFVAELIVNAVSAEVTNILGAGEVGELRELQRKLTALARDLFARFGNPETSTKP